MCTVRRPATVGAERGRTAHLALAALALLIGLAPSAASAQDAAPPTVSLTAPSAGAFVRGVSVTVSATASDNVGVAGVQFLLDGVNLGSEDRKSPFSVTWDTTSVSNGSHTVSARARDAAGNTATASRQVTVDNELPTGTIAINGNAAFTNSRSVTLTLAAADAFSPVTQMRFSNTGSTFSSAVAYATTAAWTLSSGAGSKTVYARFQDAAGNWSTATIVDSIVLDTTAPAISAVAALGITSSGATVAWTTDEAATSQVEYGRTTSYGATTPLDTSLATLHGVSLTGLLPGTLYHYRVRSADAAGNLRVSADGTFTTAQAPDTQAPSVSVTAPTAGSIVSGSAVLAADATDNVGVVGVQFLVDGVATGAEDVASPYSVTWNSTVAPDGPHVVAARARDAAGNAATSSVAITVSNTTGGELTIGETAILSGDDSGNGDSLMVQDATLSQTATIQSLTFYVTAAAGDLRLGVYDATGPGGGPGELKAQTDLFSPVIGWNTASVITPALLPAGNYWLAYFPSSSSLHFASDFTSGSYKAAALTFGLMPSTFPATASQGTTHWSLYATLTTTESPDTLPPQVSITAPSAGAQVGDIVLVTADAVDDTGVAGVQFSVDGLAAGLEDTSPPYAFQWDTRTTGNGAHTLTARARDVWGNNATSDAVAVDVANSSLFQNEVLATGFNLPTALKFLPDGRMLVVELPGTIKVLPPPYTTPNPTPFLDLHLNIGGYAGVQQGIFDLVLDPDFATNHYYYIFYTNNTPNRDRLSRFTANAALDGTVPGSELILYQDPQDANTEHHGGAVMFGNDGKIYFTTGEHFDPPEAQNLSSPRGKIHRINSDGTAPTDNPFYDGAGPHWDSVWALGLRNPYRAYHDPVTDKIYVGDVGGNEYSTAQEEVNLGARGANYGWPDCELGTCGNPNFTPAIYAYPHNGRDAAVTGGFVYRGTQFPGGYDGSYFFGDYSQNWIRRLTFNPDGSVAGVSNFEPADGSVDGPYGDIVYLAQGPDGALYYLDLGYSDVGGTFGISKVRRIRYMSNNQAPVAVASATPAAGPVPLTVQFSSAGSLDPEGGPVTYLWTFGDGATATGANPAHTYTSAGQYTVRLEVSDGVSSTLAAPLFIAAGNKPSATIVAPLDGSMFRAGDVITFGGDATDIEDGSLAASAYTWSIDFLHESHVHPGIPINGAKSGSFTIPTSGHDFSGFTRYRIMLTVTDSSGLTDTKSVTIYPLKVNITVDSQPRGLSLTLDGLPYSTPFVHDSLVNFTHTLGAPNQSTATTTYTFSSWSDGGAQQHNITVPAAATTYSASFTATSSVPVTIGETTVFGSADSGNGNLLLVQDATLSQTATIQSLSFYVLGPAGQLRLGIYDATGPGGGPGNLKAQTNAFAPGAGWNTQPVIAPVSLPAGNYWLAYLPSSSSLSFATNFSVGTYKFASWAFGPMPSTFPAITGQGTTHWSLYGTLSVPF
jgi:glucose/arabinose dehydrogenase